MTTVPIHHPIPKRPLAWLTTSLAARQLRKTYREGDRAPCHRGETLIAVTREPKYVVCPEDGVLFRRAAA